MIRPLRACFIKKQSKTSQTKNSMVEGTALELWMKAEFLRKQKLGVAEQRARYASSCHTYGVCAVETLSLIYRDDTVHSTSKHRQSAEGLSTVN